MEEHEAGPSAFGRRLAQARAGAGLSQDALAKLVPVSRSQITRLELGSRRAAPDVARRLDELLGTGGELTALAALAADVTGAAPEPGWPRRIGRIPGIAECFQTRSAFAALSERGPAKAADPTFVTILAGPGGVGKTQAATRFALERWDAGDVDLLMWITADSRAAIVAEYARAGVSFAKAPAGDREAAARWFLGWLGQTGRRWLLVLDDLARPGDLAGLWPPPNPSGRTVVTTRRRDAALAGQGRRTIEVGVFDRPDAVAYLRAKLAAHGRAEDDAALATLAEELGRLPIALAQAVAYQIDTGLDCAAYVKRLTDGRRTLSALVPTDQELPDEQRTGLAAVWSWSIQHADALPPVGLARPLLELASVLDPNGIPLDVLTSRPALEYLRRRCREGAGAATTYEIDAETAVDALHCLRRVSLAALDADHPQRIVRVHALVQRSVREELGRPGLDRVVAAAADALSMMWPDVLDHFAPASVLHANVEHLRRNGGEDLLLETGHGVLFQAGWAATADRFVDASIAYWTDLAAAVERRHGPDHRHTLMLRHELADLRGQLGEYATAVDLFTALAADCHDVLGPDHIETLSARHALLTWQGFAGDPVGAAAASAALVADWTRVAGPDDMDVLATRQSLGLWLARSGDTHAAVRCYLELASDLRRVFGPGDVLSVAVHAHLARWQPIVAAGSDDSSDRADRADSSNGSAAKAPTAVAAPDGGASGLKSLIDLAPPDHAISLVGRAVAALLRGRAGNVAAATAELRAVLAAYEPKDPDHFDTLIATHYLAEIIARAGDHKTAIAIFEDLARRREARLGPGHPTVLFARHAQAYWTAEAGAADATTNALSLFEALEDDFRRLLPATHPEALAVRHNLACRRAHCGERAEAQAALEKLLPDLVRAHTANHPRTAVAERNLAVLAEGQPSDVVTLMEPTEPPFHVSFSTGARVRRFQASRVMGSIDTHRQPSRV